MASAYVLHLYELHWSHILKENLVNLGKLRLLEDGKIYCCFFFFLNQQFITWRMEADHGSYFRNYIQWKHTNMKQKEKARKEKKRKRKKKRKLEELIVNKRLRCKY